VYISPIQLNQERGVVETPHLPVLRAATPVHAPDGMPFGIVIINIDMRPLLAELRASASQGGQVFLVDEQGNYLLNPDPAREFGADLGRPSRLQDDFPEIADLAAGERVEQRRIRLAERSIVVSAAPVRLLDGPRVLVIEMVERSALTAIGTPVRQAGLLAGLLAVVAALLLAIVLARSLSRPLGQMTAAVASFDGSKLIALSPTGNDEIGELAYAFERMGTEVRAKTIALEQETAERVRYADQARLFSAAVESSQDAIVTKTLDGTISAWNSGAEQLYGYSREEAIGQNIALVVPEDRRDEICMILERVSQGQHVDRFETVRKTKAGRLVAVSLTATPLKSEAGAITGVAVTAHDISE
ncbi:MAG TPA: PAS domain S-box protein, partial [Roseiflexaceae bacterium]|nr:PAS domain S-box protein [Roseiflexaceae bacterium]